MTSDLAKEQHEREVAKKRYEREMRRLCKEPHKITPKIANLLKEINPEIKFLFYSQAAADRFGYAVYSTEDSSIMHAVTAVFDDCLAGSYKWQDKQLVGISPCMTVLFEAWDRYEEF